MAWRGYNQRDPFSQYGGYSSSDDEGPQRNSNYYIEQKFQKQRTQTMERWPCKWCDKNYASKAGLERHIGSVHVQKPKALKAPSSGQLMPWSDQSPAKFVCRYCGNEYASQGNLNRHVTSSHVKADHATVRMTQKNTTNIVYNIYNPTYYNSNKY